MVWFILQFRDGLADNVGEEIDESRLGLHLRSVGGKGKTVLSDLQQSDTQGPYVRGDGVGLAGDALGRHVV